MKLIEPVENFKVFSDGLLTEMETNITLSGNDPLQQTYAIIQNNVSKPELANMPYTTELIARMKSIHTFENVVYRLLKPCGAYTLHNDAVRGWGSINYHVVLTTNDQCFFLYPENSEQQVYKMSTNTLWRACVNKPHTFVNAGTTDRIHITFDKGESTYIT